MNVADLIGLPAISPAKRDGRVWKVRSINGLDKVFWTRFGYVDERHAWIVSGLHRKRSTCL